MLGAQKRKEKKMRPLPEGVFQIPWSEALYELPPPPKAAAKPKSRYNPKKVTL